MLTCRNPGGPHVHADRLRGPRVATVFTPRTGRAGLVLDGRNGRERARGARHPAQGRELALRDGGADVEPPELLRRAAVALRLAAGARASASFRLCTARSWRAPSRLGARRAGAAAPPRPPAGPNPRGAKVAMPA